MQASLTETSKLRAINLQAHLTKLVNNTGPTAGSSNSRLAAGPPHTDRRRQTKPACHPTATVVTKLRFRGCRSC
jgi:hypothetical protein